MLLDWSHPSIDENYKEPVKEVEVVEDTREGWEKGAWTLSNDPAYRAITIDSGTAYTYTISSDNTRWMAYTWR